MVHVIVRHKVADYTHWKAGIRFPPEPPHGAGETGFRVFHTVDDPREVTLLSDWESAETVRADSWSRTNFAMRCKEPAW